jgi:conjugation system TraG family ATPase
MKTKLKFELPFIGTSVEDGITLLYSANGNFSVIISIENLVTQYCADSAIYESYHNLYGHIIKILGAGFILQKTDVIAKQSYDFTKKTDDYLDKKYFKYFKGRPYNNLTTYLTITQQNVKGKVFTYNPKEIKNFINKLNKVIDTLNTGRVETKILTASEIEQLQSRFMAFNFNDPQYCIENISADKDRLFFGESKEMKIVSLIDIDELNIPNSVATYTTRHDISQNFPSDNFSFLMEVPDAKTVLYNQAIFIPDQIKVKRELEAKRKRHSSMPDPANHISVNDIDSMFIDIAKDNELLVYCHYSMAVFGESEKISKAVNFIDTNLFAMGVIPGKNTYNQMELFRAAIPGNADELQKYDKFLTSRPASICFLFKEKLPKTEPSDYLIYLTDRQGIPIGIDTSDLPMQTGRITNRNKFVLGPSGTGKSFTMNCYLKQCKQLGADIVIVDTGNSYLGLDKYNKGKYITYSEDKPITMNPFKIEAVENNEEKRQILKSLVGLIWKGVDGSLSQIEDTVISKCLSDYFTGYFGDTKTVETLNFNSFYEFSCNAISELMKTESISFNYDEYKFILKKFYKGGEYEKVLNDSFDNTLFNESFIVFEIDSIKEHKLLFPITTLIIMDVFIQKMRYKSNKKILVIEEAWKAIASPMMAGYIIYLYKTIRKFNGEAIVVTQELGDIIGNAIVKDSIISNSDTVFLLDQSKFKDNFSEIARLLSLNEVEQNKIFTINRLDNREGRGRFKEVYIKRGATGEVYGIELPIEEYLTYSTERPEREALQIYLSHYDSYDLALDNLVSDLQTSGKSLPGFIKHINAIKTVLHPQKLVV